MTNSRLIRSVEHQQGVQYSVGLEIVNAVLIATLIFLLILAISSVTISVAELEFRALNEYVGRSQSLSISFGNTIMYIFMAAFLFGSWYVVIATIGVLQSGMIAIAAAKYFSEGLEVDAGRSLIFYISAGALIGGAPWWTFAFTIFDHTTDLETLIVVVLPGFIVGMIAGAKLKYRLGKLLAKTSIPNSPANAE